MMPLLEWLVAALQNMRDLVDENVRQQRSRYPRVGSVFQPVPENCNVITFERLSVPEDVPATPLSTAFGTISIKMGCRFRLPPGSCQCQMTPTPASSKHLGRRTLGGENYLGPRSAGIEMDGREHGEDLVRAPICCEGDSSGHQKSTPTPPASSYRSASAALQHHRDNDPARRE